jgi:hypothetical protein
VSVIDLIEDRVDILGELFVALGHIRRRLSDDVGLGGLVMLALRSRLTALVGWHGYLRC